jgi:uncharacterized coiled-coil DUF342 family protein
VEPEKMKNQLEEMKKHHEKLLASYLEKVEELTKMLETEESNDSIASSISVVEFGVQYERLYMEWCDQLIKNISEKISSVE